MGLSWIWCGDVAAILMTSPRVWKNNYCAKPPRAFFFFWVMHFLLPHFHKPVWRETPRSPCVLIAVTGCHSCFSLFDRSNIVPQATKISGGTHASGYLKADELFKWLIMISDALSVVPRDQDSNLMANITFQQLQTIKCIFHTSFVKWRLLLSKSPQMRNKCFSLVLYNLLMSWYVWKWGACVSSRPLSDGFDFTCWIQHVRRCEAQLFRDSIIW